MTASACSNGACEARTIPEYGLERSRIKRTALAMAMEPTASAINRSHGATRRQPEAAKEAANPSNDDEQNRIGDGRGECEGHLHSRLTERIGR